MGPLAGVSGVLLVLLGFLFWRYDAEVEARILAETAAARAEEQVKYQHDTAQMSADHTKTITDQREQHERELGDSIAEINRLRQVAEKLAQADPKAFGDDFHICLARIMCRIQAATDLRAREAFNSASPQAYLSDIAFTITVNENNAEIWREQCDDGRRDFCEWSITGFTPQAALTMLSWLERVDGYALAQGEHINGLHEIIERVSEDGDDEGLRR